MRTWMLIIVLILSVCVGCSAGFNVGPTENPYVFGDIDIKKTP